MKLFFRNLSYFKQIVILLAVCTTFSIYLGYQDSKNQVIITGVILPIFIAMFSALLNKIVESNKMYVDLKLYNYNQIKKLIDIEKHQKHLFKVFTNSNKIEKNFLFIEIENTGSTLISAVEIIINRKDPKNDSYYYLNTPLVSGQKEYIVIYYNKDSINDILLITYLNNTDKLHYFNSITHTDNFTYFKDHNNKKQKYIHRKISPKNKINLYKKYIKL